MLGCGYCPDKIAVKTRELTSSHLSCKCLASRKIKKKDLHVFLVIVQNHVKWLYEIPIKPEVKCWFRRERARRGKSLYCIKLYKNTKYNEREIPLSAQNSAWSRTIFNRVLSAIFEDVNKCQNTGMSLAKTTLAEELLEH